MGDTAPTLPQLARRADNAYLDFVESLRAFALKDGSYEQALLAALEPEEHATEIEKILGSVASLPAVQMHNRLMRSQQEMKWKAITTSLDARRDEWLKELNDYQDKGPGTLELDPNFQTPDYANVEFHLQPQGYHGDPLGGVRYHLGTKVFFTGDNDEDQLHAALVANVPEPRIPVSTVLDLACSIGQSTTALKSRFPDAQVTGIDHSAPMLRAAHRRAVLLGSSVTFSQQLAESTGFPTNSVDLVFAFIVFHELPIRIIRETVLEVARVLRPGGLFVVYDFADMASMNPVERYHRFFDARFNGEPYSEDFCDCDFEALLEESGLNVADVGTALGYVRSIFSEKPFDG